VHKYLSLVFVVVLTALLSACTEQEEVSVTQDNGETNIPVTTEIVMTHTIEDQFEISGTVSTDSQSAIMTPTGGEVTELTVSENDMVEAGDVLLRLDASEADLNVQQAEASLESARVQLKGAEAARESAIKQAELQLEQARSAYEMLQEADEEAQEADGSTKDLPEELQHLLKNLLSQSGASETQRKNEMEQARQAVEIAEQALKDAQSTIEMEAAKANIEQAEIGVEVAEQQLDHFVITSPISGQVINLNIDEGEMASPQTPLMIIIGLNELHVTANVSATELSMINAEQQVKAHIRSLQETYQGEVTSISPIPAEESRHYPIEVSLDDPPEELKPGMVVQLIFSERSEEEYVMIPVDAVLSEGAQNYVYVIEDGHAVHREVQVGEEQENYVVIVGGLDAGDEIVVNGQFRLADGAPVDIQDDDDTPHIDTDLRMELEE
jgi:RND family efflux transporter MFP subunit